MTDRKIDVLTLELLREALPAVCDEMAEVLMRTAYNMFIYEIKDFSTSIMDANGELIARPRTAGSINASAIGEIIMNGIAEVGRENMKPGDVYAMNVPEITGQHTNNTAIYKPLFYKGELIAFSVGAAHWLDVGGCEIAPGIGTQHDVYMEGLLFRHLRVIENGVTSPIFTGIIQANCRRPENTLGDFRACVGSCNIGETRFMALVEKYGLDTIKEAARIITDMTEQRIRAGVERIPDGVYEAESFLDGPVGGETMTIKVKVIIKGSDFHVDYTGTGKQVRGPINSSRVGLIAGRAAVKMLCDPHYYVTAGSFRPVSITVPRGTFISCSPEAPQGSWSLSLSTVLDTILKALAPAIPDRIPAGHKADQGDCGFYGVDSEGKYWVSASVRGGGHGGRATEDGESTSVNLLQGNMGMAALELLEHKFPLYVESYSLLQDSCGAGKFKGGLGSEFKVRPFNVDEIICMVSGERFKCPPWGLFGGKSGVGNHCHVDMGDGKGPQLATKRPHTRLPKNGYVAFRSAGGGGWGDPLDREPSRVLLDVIREYVSNEAALSEYGVVLNLAGQKVDEAATKALREKMRKDRATQPDPYDRDPKAVLQEFVAGKISVPKAITDYGVVINWDKQEVDERATLALRGQMRHERSLVAKLGAR